MEKRLLVIGGPTSSGKTALSVAVAKRLFGEIVSADSMQVYKGLDIGTSKVTADEADGVVHHMLDIVSPTVNYSVAEYVEAATKIIDDLFSRNIQPIVVGGTGFYINALLYKKSLGFSEGNEKIREKYMNIAKTLGNQAVYNCLFEIDRETAEKLSENDVKRVIRALEIYETTGIKKSVQSDKEKRYDYKIYCPTENREELYERIEKRVDEMVERGLFDEVKGLYDVLRPDSTALSAIGYKEIVEYFDKKTGKSDAIAKIKLNTRHYAKRQITYFKHQFDCVYFDNTLPLEEKVERIIEDFYS